MKVPGGTYTMGSVDDVDASPTRQVTLSSFYIDKYEVSVGEYRKCVQSGSCLTPLNSISTYCNYDKSGKDSHPVNCVEWTDAKKYCSWAGKRLPTEAEWEKAARGTDGRRYPWGESWDSARANGDMSVKSSSSVGSYANGVSPYGAYDMAGNVAEWVADWSDASYYQRSPERSPTGPESGQYRVVRGGSWFLSPTLVRASYRNFNSPDYRVTGLGFRCARGL